MRSRMPKRAMDSSKIHDQHSQILEELNRLMEATRSADVAQMKARFERFTGLVTSHFRDEEEFLAQIHSDLLGIQQKEHGILERMFDNMNNLMETSNTAQWRTAVINEAIDGFAQHFSKEDEDFIHLLSRQKRNSGKKGQTFTKPDAASRA